MTLRLAARSNQIAPSATMAMAAEARALRNSGVQVFDLALGEPDFDTPAHIGEAAKRAIQEGKTHYTPAAGIPELRAALAERYSRDKNLPTEPHQVVVSGGAKQSLHNAIMALCGPGDEVIIPAPYWVSYRDLVILTGAQPVIVPTTEDQSFLLSPDQLRAAVTPKSKLFMLNSPSNPTGSVYSPSALEALAEAILETDLGVISDEIYEDLVYEGHSTRCFAGLRPDLADRTVTISGVSKSYAMTGWRIGWAVAPAPVSKFMSSLQSQETGNTSSISQWAALEAVTGPSDSVEQMRTVFAKRRAFVLDRVSRFPGLSSLSPGGAFYAFLNISEYLGRSIGGVEIQDSGTFCRFALKEAHVALVPGSAFGAEGYARLSFAASQETLEQAFDALERWVGS